MTTVVYLVKPGDSNEELRYSLRSLVNLPHDDVVFVGHQPRWCRNVRLIPGNEHPSDCLNVYGNVRIACRHIPGDFIVMNDDIFVMRPLDGPPSWVRGPLIKHLAGCARSAWRTSLERTLVHLRTIGITNPLSYEVHTPLLINGARMEKVLAPHDHLSIPPQWRTLYGNIYDVPAEVHSDCKVLRSSTPWERDWPIVSTDDATFPAHPAGHAVRAAFPHPSIYEG